MSGSPLPWLPPWCGWWRRGAKSPWKVIVRAAIGGPPGRYRYRLVAGRRVVRSGTFRIKTTSRVRVRGATPTKFAIGRLRR